MFDGDPNYTAPASSASASNLQQQAARRGYSTRPSTSQLLARADQTSDDELLARVLAIEEDEKFAKKLQSDIAAGIEPTPRPFSALRTTAPARSEGHINTVGLDSDSGGGSIYGSTGSVRGRVRANLAGSREHVSHDELPSTSHLAHHEDVGIDRSGALHDLTAQDDDDDPAHSAESEDDDNIDMYMQSSAAATTAAATIAATRLQQHQSHRASPAPNPPRTDSLHEHLGTADMFPEETGHGSSSSIPHGTLSPRQPIAHSSGNTSSSSDSAIGAGASAFTELFAFIDAYTPLETELPNTLQPFVPDYMPSIGDIDPMLKPAPPAPPPLPRGVAAAAGTTPAVPNLGIAVLDEPRLAQTDPAVLDLQLRAAHKATLGGGNSAAPTSKIRTLDLRSGPEGAGARALGQWIKSMGAIKGHATAEAVHYSNKMPDVEKLMEQWPEEVESAFKSGEVDIPPAEIDLPLPDYSQLMCNMIDIPVYPSPHGAKRKDTETRAHVEALHVLFTLYLEFHSSAHFKALERAGGG
ncbi:Intraflagellar transport protein 46 [Geranomyces variabilis]|uniref:Intraflagellar transport protein 46 n=1 Tax=Geranomyces variabilis TaxID=109894 RepID=A0AAD5XNM0_9FUNG|nr:Intraflagellar transport protein 46 [Geranomyces variabilis]